MKISVITITYNSKKYLEETIESVLSQNFHDIEYIFVDGVSTDGTLDILRCHAERDKRIRWVSEPDRGITDAMNKGIRMATGDIVGHLHSDDAYMPGTLERVADCFLKNPEAKWVTGRMLIVDEEGETLYETELKSSYTAQSILKQNIIGHPATFFRREVFDEIGLFDETFKYAMDYDLFVRVALKYEPVVIDHLLARFRYHPGSLSSANLLKAMAEDYLIRKRNRGEISPISAVIDHFDYTKNKIVISFGLHNFLKKLKRKFSGI